MPPTYAKIDDLQTDDIDPEPARTPAGPAQPTGPSPAWPSHQVYPFQSGMLNLSNPSIASSDDNTYVEEQHNAFEDDKLAEEGDLLIGADRGDKLAGPRSRVSQTLDWPSSAQPGPR